MIIKQLSIFYIREKVQIKNPFIFIVFWPILLFIRYDYYEFRTFAHYHPNLNCFIFVSSRLWWRRRCIAIIWDLGTQKKRNKVWQSVKFMSQKWKESVVIIHHSLSCEMRDIFLVVLLWYLRIIFNLFFSRALYTKWNIQKNIYGDRWDKPSDWNQEVWCLYFCFVFVWTSGS